MNNIYDKLAEVERIIAPTSVTTALKDENVDAISEVFQQMRKVGHVSWMATCVCVGLAQSKAKSGEKVSSHLVSALGIHKSRISRLGKIYREIIAPRIEERGHDADFLIQEYSFYDTAVNAASKLGKPALELIELAEDKKLADSRYSTRKFREDIGYEKSVDGEKGVMTLAGEFGDSLWTLSQVEDDVVAAFVSNIENPQGWLEAIAKLEEILKRTRDGIVG